MKYTINCATLAEREAAQDEISRILPLPAHYGRNLDALWDEVSCMEGEIILENAAAITGYGEKILDLLREAADENPRLSLVEKA